MTRLLSTLSELWVSQGYLDILGDTWTSLGSVGVLNVSELIVLGHPWRQFLRLPVTGSMPTQQMIIEKWRWTIEFLKFTSYYFSIIICIYLFTFNQAAVISKFINAWLMTCQHYDRSCDMIIVFLFCTCILYVIFFAILVSGICDVSQISYFYI